MSILFRRIQPQLLGSVLRKNADVGFSLLLTIDDVGRLFTLFPFRFSN